MLVSVNVIQLNDTYYNDAVRLAVDAKTGKYEDISPRLKKYKQYFVAVRGKQVVGVIGWYQDDGRYAGNALGDKFPYGNDVYWVSHFAVELKFRNMGIGSLLLQNLGETVKRLGGTELWVYTDKTRGFYEKHGFKFVQKAWIEENWQEVLKKELKWLRKSSPKI